MKPLVLFSPAKLNLYLKVINKRPDGYHNIITVFERIDLCDKMSFRLNNTGKINIHCNHPQVPLDSKNLAWKVAQRLRADFKVVSGVDITIYKRIPVAAGLGGGSSNAATTILALNKLWKLNLPKKKLMDYANAIGSDVAFFVSGLRFAIGVGRGEILEPVSLSTSLWHVLVVPKKKMLTPLVYQALGLETKQVKLIPKAALTKILTNEKDDVNILIHSLRKNRLEALNRILVNDLERGILKLAGNLSTAKNRLSQFENLAVLFSGSGPSVYAIVTDKRAALIIYRKLKRIYQQVFVVKTL